MSKTDQEGCARNLRDAGLLEGCPCWTERIAEISESETSRHEWVFDRFHRARVRRWLANSVEVRNRH